MATILVVDDRPTNRAVLAALLGPGGNRVLEARNGAEALALTRAERPDLVITDILMPTMDGYELVQKLRADPEIAHTHVIFYSATYSVPEAEAMAASCGVKTILPKPADARVIIEVVGRELAGMGIPLDRPLDLAPPPAAANFPASLDPGLDACLDSMRATTRLIEELMRRNDPIFSPGGQLQPLSHRLSESLLSLERTATRLNALEDLSLLLISERSPRAIVNRFAATAARLMGVEQVAVCMMDAREAEIAWMGGHGVDLEALRSVALDRTRLPGSLLDARGVVRLASRFPDARRLPDALTGPGGFLGLPILSADRALGWACFAARSDGEAFSEDDERLAASMTTRLGAAYESALLYETVQHHAAQLQLAITERERSSAELRESEQRFRQIAENIREVFWLTDPSKNIMLYISPAYREIWGREPGALYSSPQDWLEAIHPEDRKRVAEAARTRQIRGDYDEIYRIVRPDGSIRWIEDKAFPVADANGSVYRVAGIAEDITQRRLAEAELSRINRALTVLSNCNEALIRADDESALLERICRIVVETGGYRSARVAFVMDDADRTLAIRGAAGDLPEFLRSMHISWDRSRDDGRGPASRAVQTGRPVVIEALADEPELGSTSTQAMIAALRWVAKAHPEVAVVNMSLGTTATYAGACDAASPITAALRQAGQAVRDNGAVIVAAAGNEGQTDRMTAPACVSGFLSVGAVHAEKGSLSANGCTDLKTAADRVACFSNSSTRLDLLAPGAGIVSADLGGGKTNRSGTSQAAAVVSGAVALLLEGAPGTGHRIDTALFSTGAAITDGRNGRVTPRIDTRAALAALQTN